MFDFFEKANVVYKKFYDDKLFYYQFPMMCESYKHNNFYPQLFCGRFDDIKDVMNGIQKSDTMMFINENLEAAYDEFLMGYQSLALVYDGSVYNAFVPVQVLEEMQISLDYPSVVFRSAGGNRSYCDCQKMIISQLLVKEDTQYALYMMCSFKRLRSSVPMLPNNVPGIFKFENRNSIFQNVYIRTEESENLEVLQEKICYFHSIDLEKVLDHLFGGSDFNLQLPTTRDGKPLTPYSSYVRVVSKC